MRIACHNLLFIIRKIITIEITVTVTVLPLISRNLPEKGLSLHNSSVQRTGSFLLLCIV